MEDNERNDLQKAIDDLVEAITNRFIELLRINIIVEWVDAKLEKIENLFKRR